MRHAILISLFVIFSCIANAQFTILPQLGLENSRTTISYNGHSFFRPVSAQLSPQAGVRLNYKFKQGHGPFIGIATSRSLVTFDYTNPEAVMNTYKASRGNTQLRLEGGYQLSTKPIYFNKSATAKKSANVQYERNAERKSCGNYRIKSSCGSNNYGSKANKTMAARPGNKGSWVRIQPLIGVAFIPSAGPVEIVTKTQGGQSTYEYKAGGWNTALMSGAGFEFGKNAQRKFIVSVNYLKRLMMPYLSYK